METGKILQIALNLGEILLTSGAEVYRVEETIKRVCKSYSIECDCYCTLTGIFISSEGKIYDPHSLTVIRRVKERKVDLHKIDLVNKFSRELEKSPIDYDEALERVEKIKNTPYFSRPIMILSASFNAFVYSWLFGGTPLDGFIAFFISMVIFSLKEFISGYGFFEFLQLFLAGILAGGMTLFFQATIGGFNIDKVIVGAIMVFVPGLAITTGIKDALSGDTLSSFAKIGDAALTACALGAGVGITLVIGNAFI